MIGTDTTPPLGDSFPALVFIRVISDGQTIRGEYSGDGIAWSPIGRPAKIGTGVKLGLYAADNAQDGPEVPFEFVSLNAQSDEFTGTDAREVPLVADRARGRHRLPRRQRRARDRHRRRRDRRHRAEPDRPARPGRQLAGRDEDRPDHHAEGQQAGLLLYKEPNNWIKTVLVDKNTTSQIEFVRVKDGAYQLDAPFKVDVPKTLTSFYLRLRSNGTSASAQYSTNGTTWIDVGKSRDISDLGAGSLGPVALRGDAAAPVTAKFDYVRVAPSPVEPCTAPTAPEAGYERLWNGVDMAAHHAGRPRRLRHRQRRWHRRLPPGQPRRPRPAVVQRQDLRQLRPARAVEVVQGHRQLRHLRPLPEPGHGPQRRDRPGSRDPDPRGRRR